MSPESFWGLFFGGFILLSALTATTVVFTINGLNYRDMRHKGEIEKIKFPGYLFFLAPTNRKPNGYS